MCSVQFATKTGIPCEDRCKQLSGFSANSAEFLRDLSGEMTSRKDRGHIPRPRNPTRRDGDSAGFPLSPPQRHAVTENRSWFISECSSVTPCLRGEKAFLSDLRGESLTRRPPCKTRLQLLARCSLQILARFRFRKICAKIMQFCRDLDLGRFPVLNSRSLPCTTHQ